MKRSEINWLIAEAIEFFGTMNFSLPPWAYWSPEEWKKHDCNSHGITKNQLGWDLTDFGSGNFKKSGLLLFTLRNGNPEEDKKTYAEKIMIVEENQLTPLHLHRSKMEDIINRGGGNLMMELYASNKQGGLDTCEFEVSLDGIQRFCQVGERVILKPGESITLQQGLYHKFYGEQGKGKVLVGEVSAVNDDHSDNYFYESVGRFPEIEEDEAMTHLLVGDYKILN